MKVNINRTNSQDFIDMKTIKFSDGCWHVQLPDDFNPTMNNYEYDISIHYEYNDDPVLLLMVKSAIRNAVRNKKVRICWNIQMPFFPYARQDRVCSPGQADGLDVFLKLISEPSRTNEEMHIESVDIHNFENTRIISMSYKIGLCNTMPYNLLTRSIKVQPDWIICPDKGAMSRAKEAARKFGDWTVPGANIISFDKHRDPATGKIEGIQPVHNLAEYKLQGSNCLIIDDICDGGGTFLPIIAMLKAQGANVSLFVTHGIFSKGIDMFTDIDTIYTTTSIPLNPDFKGKVVCV